ncbi:MAG: pyridoxamine 5'-phosphate oxidase family protein [Pyrinomonadaceae bacterium]
MGDFPHTNRTTMKRLPQRGFYDRETIYQILDEGLICHVGFIQDGLPVVIPTGYGRVDDAIYIHGSKASRMLKAIKEGIEICVTVTLLDGLVLARSAFHHSMNYRSVVIFGKAWAVEHVDEKLTALKAISEHIIPGRWSEVRHPSEEELRATQVLRLPLISASAKIRSGPPIDDDEDYSLPVWAGAIPLTITASTAVSDPRLAPEISVPDYVLKYKR